MESVTALCGVFLILYVLVKFINTNRSRESSLKLPPGPKPLPIIGNLHQLLGSQTHHILRDLAKRYGPLMHLQLGEVSTLIVSSPEAAEQFMKTHDTIFSYRPQLLAPRIFNYDCTDIAFAPFGDYWRQLRKICMMELLSSKRVQSFRSIREEEVLNLITSISLQKGTAINLSRKIFSFTYGVVSRAAFGKKSKYQEEYISLVEETIKMASGFSIADMYPSVKFIQVISEMSPKFKKVSKNLDAILESIVKDHRERNTRIKPSNGETNEDLVDVLLNIQNSGDFGAPLTDNNIKAVIMVRKHLSIREFYIIFHFWIVIVPGKDVS